jgi:signal peptidase I
MVGVGAAFVGQLSARSSIGPPIVPVPYPYLGVTLTSASMEPTAHCAKSADKDCEARSADFLLEELSGARSVHRGDIISFQTPAAASAYCVGDGGGSVKRVIGIGGDRVSIRRGVVFLNGRRLAEPYVPKSERDTRSGSWLIPKGSFFVMGDYRAISCDSRFWGPLKRSLVNGRIVEIIRRAGTGSNPIGPPTIRVHYPYEAADPLSAAMEPTLHCAKSSGDKACEAKVADTALIELSGTRHVHRGTIVVFSTPPSAPPSCVATNGVARAIGLPGDRITETNGVVRVDGRLLREPYVPTSERDHLSGGWHVPQASFFVMADYRAGSCDSRVWGAVPAHLVHGRVVEIIRFRSSK